MPPAGEARGTGRAGAWIVVLALALFLVLNLTTIRPGHPPGGDFAHYIIHAQNLLAGRDYASGVFMPGVRVQNYPPGFPLILAPLLHWAGVNLPLLKLPTVLMWPLCAWLLALIARRRLGGQTALLVFLFMLFAPWFFVFKQNILSDVPFTLLVLAALWAFVNYQEQGARRGWWLAWFLVFSAASLLLRTAGLALVGAALLYLVFQRRAWGTALLTAATAAAVLALQKLLSASAGGYLALLHDPAFWLGRLAGMLPAKLAKVPGLFFPVFRGGYWLLAGVEAAAGVALACLAAWGWLRRPLQRRGWDVGEAFVVLYMLMILLWPFNEGPRFYAPVAGLLLIYFAQGLLAFFAHQGPRRFSPRGLLHAVLWAGLALNLFNIALLWGYSGDVVQRPADKQLYAWVRQNLGPGQHYLYAYPRVLALFSGRTGDKYYWNQPLAAQMQRLESGRLDWLILRNQEDRAAVAAAARHPALKLIWSGPRVSVFRLQPTPKPRGGAGRTRSPS